MNEFSTLFFRRLKAELLFPGFKRCGQTLVRVKNDVMQAFSLKCWRGGGMCDVEFGVVPLCLGIENIGVGVSYNLCEFERYTSWIYGGHTLDGMNQAIDEILRYIREYLHPFFEQVNSTQNALGELLKIERRFEQNRQWYLAKQHMTDCATLETKIARVLLDPVKYYIALKQENYKFALACHKALLKQNIDSLHAVSVNPSFSAEDIEERKLAIEQIRKEVENLEKGDVECFREIIIRNEEISAEFLKQKGIKF